MAKETLKTKNSHWLTFVLVKDNLIRDKLLSFINSKGIEAKSGFYSAHQMDIYKNFKNKKIDYANSKKISSSIITLPSFVNLKNEEIDYICKLIKSYFK